MSAAFGQSDTDAAGRRAPPAALALLALAALVLFLQLDAASALAATPEEAIAFTNQQRTAYGIPPITLDQSLLQPVCDLENHEIASPTTAWSTTSSPWDRAPLHEAVLYDPEDTRGSYGEYDSFGAEGGIWACMWFSREAPEAPPAFYWAAEASGPGAVPPALNAFEAPATPAEYLGLPNPTGPNLIAYATRRRSGYPPVPLSASVAGPGGVPVATHLLTQSLPSHTVAVVVDRPLAPWTAYETEVLWQIPAASGEPEHLARQEFSFVTGAPLGPEGIDPEISLEPGARHERRIAATLVVEPALIGQTATIHLRKQERSCGSGGRCSWRAVQRRNRALPIAAPQTPLTFAIPPAGYRLEVRVTTRQFVPGAYTLEKGEASMIVPGSGRRGPHLATARPRGVVRRGKALIRLRCPAGDRCRGRLTLLMPSRSRSGPRSIAIGRSRFALAGGRARTLRVGLTRRGSALLHAAGKGKVRVGLRGTGVRNRRVTLRIPR